MHRDAPVHGKAHVIHHLTVVHFDDKDLLQRGRQVLERLIGERPQRDGTDAAHFLALRPQIGDQILAQVLPFFAISIFLPLVLTKMNIQNPNASGVLYNVFTLIGVLVGLWIYGIATRRAYLLWTFYVSAAILTVMILWTSMSPLVALIMITAFALVLAASIVPEFSYPAELFPTELRGSGVGLTIAISRFGAGGGTFLLPIVSEQFGIHMALWCCVITLLFGGIICHMWAPETSGRGKK